MKRITACCLSLLLALLMVCTCASAEEAVEIKNIEYEPISYDGLSDGGRFVRLREDLPLEFWQPDYMMEAEIGEDSTAEGLLRSWYILFSSFYADITYYAEAPLPWSEDAVSQYRAKGLYSDIWKINGVPAIDYCMEEAAEDGVPWSYENYFYFLDSGACVLLQMRYPSENDYMVPFTIDDLKFSVRWAR